MAEPAPYRFGIDDAGAAQDGPLGGENVLTADPNDPTPVDPAASEAAFRLALLTKLDTIIDLLGDADAP